MIRKIIHIDMDAFYASVEQRDFPEYRGKPVAVGGSRKRGVVAAASYEARKFGVFSAMPSITAYRKCPDIIFVKPRFEVYRDVSHQIRDIFFQYTDLVEPLSLDEAYLDVTHNKKEMPSATIIAKQIKAQIKKETQLTASAGISLNKFLAKTASGMNKPDGLTLIHPDEAEAFISRLSIEKFYGIGKVTAAKMNRLGIYNGAILKEWPESELIRQFGKSGRYFYQIARAIDDRPVNPNRIRKSIGAENTFSEDLKSRKEILLALRPISQKVVERMLKSRAFGRTLTLKVKYADFQVLTRSRTLGQRFVTDEKMLEIAEHLLPFKEPEKGVRLLGLSVSNLEKPSSEGIQLTLDF